MTPANDAADAARYRYLVASGMFRAASIDMSGNHTWMGVGRPIGTGPTLNDAIDAKIRQEAEEESRECSRREK